MSPGMESGSCSGARSAPASGSVASAAPAGSPPAVSGGLARPPPPRPPRPRPPRLRRLGVGVCGGASPSAAVSRTTTSPIVQISSDMPEAPFTSVERIGSAGAGAVGACDRAGRRREGPVLRTGVSVGSWMSEDPSDDVPSAEPSGASSRTRRTCPGAGHQAAATPGPSRGPAGPWPRRSLEPHRASGAEMVPARARRASLEEA